MDPSALAYVKSRLNGRTPTIGIILGSGLGKLGDRIANPVIISYTDIPGFPPATAIGHEGNFICGQFGGQCIIAMQGRYHIYEGYTLDTVTMPFRLMVSLGIKTLFTTNASGALNPNYVLGDLMVLNSHINMIGVDIRDTGKHDEEYYDSELRNKLFEVAEENGTKLREGLYIAVSGPSYETASEHFYFASIGGDAIGMSTVPDVELAYEYGIKVLAVSIVADAPHYETDALTGAKFRIDEGIDGDEVVRIAGISAEILGELLEKLTIQLVNSAK